MGSPVVDPVPSVVELVPDCVVGPLESPEESVTAAVVDDPLVADDVERVVLAVLSEAPPVSVVPSVPADGGTQLPDTDPAWSP